MTELGFNTCQKLPAGKRAVKMNLKPEVELPELVAWISSVTCKSFVLPGHLSAGGKKLTFVTQGTMTRDEAYAVFLTALDSVGLTVERGPGYNKIIETTKAKMGSIPVYGFDGKATRAAVGLGRLTRRRLPNEASSSRGQLTDDAAWTRLPLAASSPMRSRRARPSRSAPAASGGMSAISVSGRISSTLAVPSPTGQRSAHEIASSSDPTSTM